MQWVSLCLLHPEDKGSLGAHSHPADHELRHRTTTAVPMHNTRAELLLYLLSSHEQEQYSISAVEGLHRSL